MQNPEVNGRITYCAAGDASIEVVETGQFEAGTSHIELMLSGYPGNSGINLEAVAAGTNDGIALATSNPGEKWQRVRIAVPDKLAGSPFRIRLSDNSAAGFGWAGIGAAPARSALFPFYNYAPVLAGLLIAHFWMLAITFSFPTRLGALERVVSAILGIGILSLVTVAGYVVHKRAGQTLAVLSLAAPFALALNKARASRIGDAWLDLLRCNRQMVPSFLLSGLVLWIGLFPFDWDGSDWGVPARRWMDLPVDAWLPYVFGEMLRKGQIDVPMIGDWLSSDRPPLQSGLYLILRNAWPGNTGLIYQFVSTWAQTLVLIPLQLLLLRSVSPASRGVIIFGVATSALVVLNSLFVWPKLIAAAYCAIYHYALFKQPNERKEWLVAGSAAAFAMMSHGGSLFILVGSTLAFAVLRRRAAFQALLKTGLIAVILYTPWIYYQRVVDPPGDRLLKWHFAGHVPVTDASFFSVLREAYSSITFKEWMDNRLGNMKNLATDAFSFFADSARLVLDHDAASVSRILERSFYFTAYSMWFASPLLLVPLLAIFAIRRKSVRSYPWPGGMALATALFFVFWSAVMFQPASTVIHQGAYLGTIFTILLVLLMLAWINRYLLYAVVAANCMVFLLAYAFDDPLRAGYSTATTLVTLIFTGFLAIACIRASQLSQQDRILQPDPVQP